MYRHNYILQAFGYDSWADLNESCWHFSNPKVVMLTVNWSVLLGAVAMYIESVTGLLPWTFVAFFLLIMLETVSGVQVALKRGDKFSSRKFGRMFLKLGYYLAIITILNLFNKQTNFPEISDFEIDPFLWLYHAFVIAIVMQLLVSVLENLGRLGYKESKSIVGMILRKFDKWFDIEPKADVSPYEEEEQ